MNNKIIIRDRIILTLSNTLIRALYNFKRPAKLTKAVILLLARLFRRYLLVFKLNQLLFRIFNFNELIGFF